MKALTICQPYAHLIALGEKIVENRRWVTNYRGPLLIHAGKSRAWMDYEDGLKYPEMAFGAVVAVAELVDCVHHDNLSDELKRHPHALGPVCWVLGNVRRVPTPYPCSGAQGLWDMEDGTAGRILAQVRP